MVDDEASIADEHRTAPSAGRDVRPAEADPTLPGTIIDRKYRVERVLGAGGMGVVVAAKHLELGGRVALKFVRVDEAAEEAVERFRREARIAFRLKSEHVARLLDLGSLPSGAPYIVMEYLEGSDLAAVLAEEGPLPVSRAVEYVLQACKAMSEAHKLGIVHRDLKPSNLFLCDRGDAPPILKVLDFGIAKAVGGLADAPAPESITRSQSSPGSPLYMSPEQVRGAKDIDARSDVWALGVILHELVAGEAPFAVGPASAICAAIVADPPKPLRQCREDAPEALEAIVLKCLEKDPKRRYPGVIALANALAPLAPPAWADTVRRVDLDDESPVVNVAAREGEASDASQSTDMNPPPRPKRLVYAIGLVIIVAAIGGLSLAHRSGGERPPGAPTSAETQTETAAPPQTPPRELATSAPVPTASMTPAPTVTVLRAAPSSNEAESADRQRRSSPRSSRPATTPATPPTEPTTTITPQPAPPPPTVQTTAKPVDEADLEERATSRRR